MRRVVLERPDSYSGQNRWKNRPTKFAGETFVSSWEVAVAEVLLTEVSCWKKNRKSFPYTWKGKRQYFPDFYVGHYKVYVEVKGRKTERDLAKWKQFPGRLLVLTGRGLSSLREDPTLIRLWLSSCRADNGNHYLLV